jgi:hypothetical protein
MDNPSMEGYCMTRLSLILASSLLLAGCSGFVQDFKNLEGFARAPTVAYQNADAWRCDQRHSTNRKGAVEVCGLCQNISGLSQGVALNGEAFQVEPKGAIVRCSDRAWQHDRTMPLPPVAEATR